MFKKPEGYGYSPFKSARYWAVMVGCVAAFIGVFGLGVWILETTGDDWFLMLLCILSVPGFFVVQYLNGKAGA